MSTKRQDRVRLFFSAWSFFGIWALLFLLVPTCLVVAQTASSILVVTNVGRVLRVFSEGRIEVVPGISLEPRSGALGHGTTAPVPSPDQRLVALTRDNDLWLIDLDKNKQTKVTSVGKPYTKTYASIFVYITAWSWDSRQILYSVEHGETEDPEGETPTLEVRYANYGFYVYDLEKKTSRAVSIPGEFLAWLPDGDFLLTSQTHLPKERELLRVKPGKTTPKAVTSVRGWYGQINVSTDGRWALTSIGQGKSSTTSQILRIDLVNGGVTSVTPAGKWAEYQAPQFSSSGTHVAYLWRQGQDSSRLPKGMLVVDGQPIYPFVGYLSYRWIDEQSVVIWRNTHTSNEEEVAVIDSKTGKVNGQRVFQ